MTGEAVGVSIVTFHSDLVQLERTLSGLCSQTTPATKVRIHVNEATETETEAVSRAVSRSGLDAVVTSSTDNRGFAAAHNQLLESLFDDGAAYVLVLNPDVELAPPVLDELTGFAVGRGAVLCGPVLLLADPASGKAEGRIDTVGIVWTASGRHLDDRQGEPDHDLPGAPAAVAGLSGACVLVSRDAHQRVVRVSGEFFDADFIAYREDAELAYRSALLGVDSWLVPTAVGLHARGLRGTSRTVSPHVNRLGVRNRFLIAAKYGRHRPGGNVQPWLRDLVVLAGVAVRERSSWSGVTDAWRLRRHMRTKGQLVLAAAGHD